MAVKVYNPLTPGLRHTSVIKNVGLTKNRPEKSLIIAKRGNAGRNNTGKITVRHRGGGHKRFIRMVDFNQDKFGVVSKIASLEYDPNRNTHLALLQYQDGEKRYIVAYHGAKVGDEVVSYKELGNIKLGNRMPLKYIPTGTEVYNIELTPGGGGKLGRSAGNAATFMALDGGKAQLKMPSGELRLVQENCAATIGTPGNIEHRNIRWGKAGRMRHRGWRPSVRGKAMNPVDHPHGGGEARNPIGLKHPKTYTGKIALGVKTRKSKKYSNRSIIKRRKNRNLNS